MLLIAVMLLLFLEKEESSDDKNIEEGNETEKIIEEEPMSVIEILAAHKEEVNKKKLKIAQLSMDVVEDPYENVSKITTKRCNIVEQ